MVYHFPAREPAGKIEEKVKDDGCAVGIYRLEAESMSYAFDSSLPLGISILSVIPAQAGIQKGPSGPLKNHFYSGPSRFWIPACAGMTKKRRRLSL